jgi:asparagine synthase (glutamine-hydrolysing)
MCGIAGIFNYYSSRSVPSEVNVKRMLAMINHRGPDESGVLVDKNVGIGNVRLSIVDLASGQQPMSDTSGRYWIVYNGEIFNFPELKVEMQREGVKFRTNCDTEIVVQMYAHYGADCLNKFNGQFAFCIWDRHAKELFLARDRMGIRPLFYWSQKNQFAFCSEIKGLFALEEIERNLAPDSLNQIFTFWTTISPQTPFKNIFEIPPGHYMRVNSSGLSIQKFWELDFIAEKDSNEPNFSDTLEELDELLHDAVKIRLRADVPVGAYLSGGLDSSVTTAFIKDIFPGILNTYSIGFAEKAYDETAFQQEVASFLNTNHTAFTCTTNDILDNFEKTVWHTEFPLLRTSPTPMYLLSKKVRESNIKVVITGEGADEILAGYNIFKEQKIRRFWANQPQSTVRPKLLSKLYPYLPMMKESPDFALRLFFGYKLGETANPLYSHLLRWNNTNRIKTFLTDGFSLLPANDIAGISAKLPTQFNKWSGLAQSQYLETSIFMSGYLLSSQGDRVAMGNSVEGRYPFLDYRLIEFCSKLPDRFKLNGLNEKFILKRLSKGRIPDSVSNRSKQAYRAPISNSFCNADAPSVIKEVLTTASLQDSGIFDPVKVSKLINSVNGANTVSEIDQMAITGIVSTQLLYNLYVKGGIRPDTSVLNNYRLVSATSL